MTGLARRAETELNLILASYAAGEAEVVREFFAQPRTREQQADMVRRQMGRELFCIDWLEAAVRQAPELERTVERHRFVEMLDQLADELKHYAVLADLCEWLLGRKLTAEEASEYKVYAVYEPALPMDRQKNPRLPEANKMIDLMQRYRTDFPVEFSYGVLKLTEGGGGGSFGEASRQSGDEFRERFAATMKAILDDEIGHGPLRVRAFSESMIRDEADLELACRLLREYMAQHLRVRNEIYGYPLSSARIAAIDRGEIEPWTLPTLAAAHS